MSDIVERLRRRQGLALGGRPYADLYRDAADEIERLRGALLAIAEMRVPVLPSRFMDESMAEYARAALGKGQ